MPKYKRVEIVDSKEEVPWTNPNFPVKLFTVTKACIIIELEEEPSEDWISRFDREKMSFANDGTTDFGVWNIKIVGRLSYSPDFNLSKNNKPFYDKLVKDIKACIEKVK